MQLYALEPLLKIFYTFACKRFPGKYCRQICGKSEKKCLVKFKHGNGPQNLIVKSFGV